MLGILGACPVIILIFDGRFLLTNLVHLALNFLIWALGDFALLSLTTTKHPLTRN